MSKNLEIIKIMSNITNEQADVNGVLLFACKMNDRLTECRNNGKSGWHKPGTICPTGNHENEIGAFKERLQTALNEGRMIDVANYSMMIYHREEMNK